MTERLAAGERPALLNALLGVALLLACALDILLLADIGRSSWQRANLTQRWLQETHKAGGTSGQAGALADAAASAAQSAEQLLGALPTDADVARFVTSIPTHAAAWGVTVLQVSPQPPTAALTPQRSFLLRVQGAEGALASFLAGLAEAAPTGARIDNVSLQFAGASSRLELALTIAVREAGPCLSQPTRNTPYKER